LQRTLSSAQVDAVSSYNSSDALVILSLDVNSLKQPIPMSALPRACVFGRSLSQIAVQNLARGTDVCLLRVLCVVR